MLSPNATNFVRVSVCVTRTDTVKPQAACILSASVAVHAAAVSPNGTAVPCAGVHSTAYGLRPPIGCGESNCTSAPSGLEASTTTSAGQLIRSWSGGGGGG